MVNVIFNENKFKKIVIRVSTGSFQDQIVHLHNFGGKRKLEYCIILYESKVFDPPSLLFNSCFWSYMCQMRTYFWRCFELVFFWCQKGGYTTGGGKKLLIREVWNLSFLFTKYYVKNFKTRENIQLQNLIHLPWFRQIMANCQIMIINISNSLWDARIENSFHIHMSKSFESRCNW